MPAPSPAFARDLKTARYYDQRAAEYDEWYESRGRFADQGRPGWATEVAGLIELVRSLPAARTLDVACGSGFLTQYLRGIVVGLDQSRAMVALARQRLPDGLALVGSALDLPFADGEFERVLNDGSRHRVYKRYLSAEQLATEIGGQIMLEGTWFVAAKRT